MERITVTFQLTPDELVRVARVLANQSPVTSEQGGKIEGSLSSSSAEEQWGSARQFGQLLHGATERLVRFVIKKGPEFYNDELASELGFANPAFTSSVLGKITPKLRRVGIRAEGHSKTNWYTKHSSNGRTLLRVRPDVFEAFKQSQSV